MDIRQVVGDNVRLLRHRRDWPQEELSVRAKMSKTYIGDIERGKVAVTVVRLEKIANALEVPLPLLVTKDGHRLAD
jgi:XRE family transcriptional regulator, regulator of sulfur utilization